MKDHLSVPARILVAFASGALIAVFFLPVWRIDLFAPQYPEGLTMYIWINNITGQVDIINGLNHYIGMKHITVAMFPEFKFLPYVVGFFMLLGMIVAVTGRSRFLLYYLALTVAGGAMAMIDFYNWGYKYGHNLDPTAPIQVPGLSYQPPLLGHKRLLNFDAYSFPDVGGWIVVGAAILAFAVWFADRSHRRKLARKKVPVAAAAMTLVLFGLMSCNSKPQLFRYGQDVCDHCKMTIVDPKFGGELLTKKGRAYKFDDLACMIRFMKSNEVKEESISKKLAIRFGPAGEPAGNNFIDVAQAYFLVSPGFKTPMGGHAAAFATRQDAEMAQKTNPGDVLSWADLYQRLQ